MPNVHTNGWSPELDARILQMRSEKLTYELIGEAIGQTRSAVSGRIRRLGFAKVREFLTLEEAARRKRVYNVKYKREMRAGTTAPQKQRRAVTVRELENVGPRHVSLLDLAPNGCKWPYGDGPFTFCGCNRAEGKPYCYPHLMQGTEPARFPVRVPVRA
jgi:hypothetical protein